MRRKAIATASRSRQGSVPAHLFDASSRKAIATASRSRRIRFGGSRLRWLVGKPSRRLRDRDRNVEQLHALCDVSESHRDGLKSATSSRRRAVETVSRRLQDRDAPATERPWVNPRRNGIATPEDRDDDEIPRHQNRPRDASRSRHRHRGYPHVKPQLFPLDHLASLGQSRT